MNHIVFATDFGASSRNAARYAAAMARSIHANLILYHAIETPAATTMNAGIYYNDEYRHEDARQQLETWKQSLLTQTEHEITITTHLRYGNMQEQLKQLQKEEGCFMTIMASTGKDRFERLLFGSHTLPACKDCVTPVLFVPNHAEFTGLKTIVLATDLDEVYHKTPLRKISEWLRCFSAKLQILHIGKSREGDGNDVSQTLALQTHFSNMNPEFSFIKNDDVKKGIADYISGVQPDLLILTEKEEPLWHTSVSRYFILHPIVPVLIFPYK